MRGPGRREIGHGALAERALLAVMPSIVQAVTGNPLLAVGGASVLIVVSVVIDVVKQVEAQLSMRSYE